VPDESAARHFVLIGHPVGHSVSPEIHRAAYRALGLAGCSYHAADCVDEAAVKEQISRLRRGAIAGANVTVPHKRLALALADDADSLARKTGAANVLVRDGDRVIAYNTDVPALADELRRGRRNAERAVVIGNGGAALAAVVALESLGVGDVSVVARRWLGESPPSDWPRAEQMRRLGASVLAWPVSADDRWNAVAARADILVQATSAGMQGADDGGSVSDIVPWRRLDPTAFAYDVVYNPPATAFLDRARDQGLPHAGGLGMLVGQAAHAIRIWLGRAPPTADLREAAERALLGMSHG
jgi:shikimate dehydrogenase